VEYKKRINYSNVRNRNTIANLKQRFCEIAKYVVNFYLSFARKTILVEKSRLGSFPLHEAKKSCVQLEQTKIDDKKN
jgi:hypothetical protein